MSKYIASQIGNKVKELFEKHIDAKDLKPGKDPEYEIKMTSRCLAAFGVQYLSNCSFEIAGDSVVDSGDDNGIDAIYFDPNKKNLIIIQSKFIQDGSGEPQAKDLRSFKDGIFDLLEKNLVRFNEKVKKKRSEIEAISQFGVRCSIALVYTGKSELAKHSTQIIEDILKNLNNSDEEDKDPIFKFHLVSRQTIMDSLARNESYEKIDLDFILKEYGELASPHKAIYGRIQGTKIGEWWKKYKDSLFQDNIRKMLGNTEVNEQITLTATEKPDLFWYFNNGITILADQIEKTPENRNNKDFGVFKLTNASIVNGAQTVSVLGKLEESGIDLSNIQITLRAISIEQDNELLRKEITRTNNTQNSILSRDFVSQDAIQESLSKQVSLLNYTYHIKRDSSYLKNDQTFDLDEAIESLVISFGDPSYAAAYRKEIGRFYVSDKTPYKALFNPSISGYHIINSVLFNREASKTISIKSDIIRDSNGDSREYNILESGSLLIKLLLYKVYCKKEKNRITVESANNLINWNQSKLTDFLDQIWDPFKDYVQLNYPTNYLSTLFQNVEKCSDIFRNIENS